MRAPARGRGPSAEAHLCLLVAVRPSSHTAIWSAILPSVLSGAPRKHGAWRSHPDCVAGFCCRAVGFPVYFRAYLCAPNSLAPRALSRPVTVRGLPIAWLAHVARLINLDSSSKMTEHLLAFDHRGNKTGVKSLARFLGQARSGANTGARRGWVGPCGRTTA